ncbi:MAG: hypothetical protein RIB93_24715 [Coleofasciculus sp. D1-CHI-01]|uniref:hypothetical protein n=1 Tax=Coleofasciculus sp. D1-CHI-01 TaxID=3068482 RepID=UPI0032F76307
MTEKARDRTEQPDSRHAVTERGSSASILLATLSILLATHSQSKCICTNSSQFNKTYSVDSINLITIELIFSHKRIR